jgi:hypothetical protein
MADPIAPPEQETRAASVETVTPGTGARPVATVTLDYPPRFTQIVKDLQQAETSPEARTRISDAVTAHDTESKIYRPNQKTQWDKVLINAWSKNWNEALKWYNGGAVKEEEAQDALGNLYWKERNEIGFTGRIRDAEGTFLTPKQIKQLYDRGGVMTDTDKKAVQTAGWSNAQTISKLAAEGLASVPRLAQADAYQAARTAGSANNNIDEQLQLSHGLAGVLDHMASLPEDKRKRILGYVNRLNQINRSQGTTTEKGISGTAGGQQTEGSTAGLQGSLGLGKAGAAAPEGGVGAVVPPGMGISGGGSLGGSTSATTYGSATGRAANTAQANQAALNQETQNLQTAIMEELQGAIKTPKEFTDFMRLQALNAANDESYAQIPNHVKPPTWTDVSATDPYLGGSKAMQVNRINQQRNNALMAAWSKELYRAQQKAATTGTAANMEELATEFQKSQIFEAINNTYAAKMKSFETGVKVVPPKGALMVNKRNEIGRSPGE